MNQKIFAHELIVRSAEAALSLQNPDGSMPAGHNGPHQDPETHARNTGHWLIVWGFSARLTNDPRFFAAANHAADYLLTSKDRPHGFTYHHRSTPNKDRCNGLMGPAFSIESLVGGGISLDRPELLDLAAELAEMHPFVESRGLWQVREIDGSLLGFDETLNHQIWFASALSSLFRERSPQKLREVEMFVDDLKKTMVLRPDGRIRHLAGKKSLIAELRFRFEESRSLSAKAIYREKAYHMFNLFPLALIKRDGVRSNFWNNPKLKKAVDFVNSPAHLAEVEAPEFVQPYIPAGFPLFFAERALVDEVFETPDPEKQSRLMSEQFARTFNPKTSFLDLGTIDPITQSARIYEMCKLHQIEIEWNDERTSHA